MTFVAVFGFALVVLAFGLVVGFLLVFGLLFVGFFGFAFVVADFLVVDDFFVDFDDT